MKITDKQLLFISSDERDSGSISDFTYEHAERCLKTIIAYRKASIASVVTKNRYEEEKHQAEEMDRLYKQRLRTLDDQYPSKL